MTTSKQMVGSSENHKEENQVDQKAGETDVPSNLLGLKHPHYGSLTQDRIMGFN